jgi:hypothetical protein
MVAWLFYLGKECKDEKVDFDSGWGDSHIDTSIGTRSNYYRPQLVKFRLAANRL